MQLCTNTANTTEVHAASAHNLVLLFSHSEMKFAQVKFKRPIIPARTSPRPPETWLRSVFTSLQAVALSPVAVSLPPTRWQGALLWLPWPRLSRPLLCHLCLLTLRCRHTYHTYVLSLLGSSCPRAFLQPPRVPRAPAPLPGLQRVRGGGAEPAHAMQFVLFGCLSFAFCLFLSLFFFNYSISTTF